MEDDNSYYSSCYSNFKTSVSKEELLIKYEPLCKSWAYKMTCKYKYVANLREDLEQEARLMVWKVLDKWDSRISKFGTYAKMQLWALERDIVKRGCRYEGVCVKGIWPTGGVEEGGEVDSRYVYDLEDRKRSYNDFKLVKIKDKVYEAMSKLSSFERDILVSKVVSGTSFVNLKNITSLNRDSNRKLVNDIIKKAKGDI